MSFQTITDDENIDEIQIFLANIQYGKNFLNEIKESLTSVNSNYQSFALQCDKQIIGLASKLQFSTETVLISMFFYSSFFSAVKIAENVEFFKVHYNLSTILNPYIQFEDRQGIITNAVISPLFQKHENYFARQIHILSQCDILYYKLMALDSKSHDNRPSMHFLDNMTHAMPRQQPEYDLKVLEENGKVSED